MITVPNFVLFLLTINYASFQILRFSLVLDETKLILKGGLGTPKQNQLFGIDLSNTESISFEKQFNASNSSSYSTTKREISFINKTQGLESSDYINLANFSMQDFHFIHMPSTIFGFSIPHLGLGKGKGSFIDQLYNKGFIKHKVFHINKDSLCVGGSPYEPKDKCDMIPFNKKYYCNLDYIVFSNTNNLKGNINAYDNLIVHQKASFETIVFLSFMPIKYLRLFKSTLFKGFFEENKCLQVDNYNSQLIYCLDEVIDSLPNMHLVFGTVDVMINTSQLWMDRVSNIVKMREFMIEFDLSIEEFVFGLSIIQHIPITVSEEENYLSFHSINVSKTNLSLTLMDSSLGMVSFICAIGILITGIIMMIFIKAKIFNSKLLYKVNKNHRAYVNNIK